MKSIIKFVVISALMFGAFITCSPDAHAATPIRNAAMASANTQKGARYVWGAEGGYSNGYDCSGLTYWAYKRHGKTLARTAQGQYNKSQHISASAARPGDLIFIRDAGGVYHVGIYTGVKNGLRRMTNANTGSYRGRQVVVDAPVYEYTAGPAYAVYGRY